MPVMMVLAAAVTPAVLSVITVLLGKNSILPPQRRRARRVALFTVQIHLNGTSGGMAIVAANWADDGFCALVRVAAICDLALWSTEFLPLRGWRGGGKVRGFG